MINIISHCVIRSKLRLRENYFFKSFVTKYSRRIKNSSIQHISISILTNISIKIKVIQILCHLSVQYMA